MNPPANLIRERKEDIINEWDKRVREEIEASKEAQPLALRNFLPFLMDELAEILDEALNNPQRENKANAQMIKYSQNHGRHRATSKNYSAEQVI